MSVKLRSYRPVPRSTGSPPLAFLSQLGTLLGASWPCALTENKSWTTTTIFMMQRFIAYRLCVLLLPAMWQEVSETHLLWTEESGQFSQIARGVDPWPRDDSSLITELTGRSLY